MNLLIALLEAVVAGLPVLAANEPYVTDVVEPTAYLTRDFLNLCRSC